MSKKNKIWAYLPISDVAESVLSIKPGNILDEKIIDKYLWNNFPEVASKNHSLNAPIFLNEHLQLLLEVMNQFLVKILMEMDI